MTEWQEARDRITGDSWADDLARASLSAAEAKFGPPPEHEVHVRARSYEVSVWPGGHADNIDAATWCVSACYRGNGKWAVVRGGSDGGPVLRSDGNWVIERIPSSRDDEWLAAHRYPLGAALDLARDWAPRVRINGMTAAEALARHLEQGMECCRG